MANPRPLLERLMNTPDIAKIVPHLQPEVLHRVVKACGLEDCAELVALATPAQLESVLDADIWRIPAPGLDEEFDPDRFGVWLSVLMQAGVEVAAEKLAALDLDLVIAGVGHHMRVFDHAAVEPFTTLDGEQAGGREGYRGPGSEIGGYAIEATRSSAWEAIVDLLVFLDAERHDYFRRLMHGCVLLSSGPQEEDGFHDLLQDREQDMFDLACTREARRDRQGFVTPAQARAFLQGARQLRLDNDQPPPNPVSRAYFRAIAQAPPGDGNPPSDGAGDAGSVQPASGAAVDSRIGADADSPIGADAIAGVIEVLHEAGVLTRPRALLGAAEAETTRLPLIRAYVGSQAASPEELAFLANTLMAGCFIQERPFRGQEASDAVAGVCNLGLENWPAHWRERNLVMAFQVGWNILHRLVCLYAAQGLIEVLSRIDCEDRDIQMRLNGLQRELTRHLRDEAPWRARDSMDVIVMLDAPCWAALLALIDECPMIHAAVAASGGLRHSINAGEFEFISENSQIESIRGFMESLPSRLTL